MGTTSDPMAGAPTTGPRVARVRPTRSAPFAGAVGPAPVPCAARPGTAFLHADGRCGCFTGGPAPEFGPSTQ